jgi:hypothetical protein
MLSEYQKNNLCLIAASNSVKSEPNNLDAAVDQRLAIAGMTELLPAMDVASGEVLVQP